MPRMPGKLEILRRQIAREVLSPYYEHESLSTRGIFMRRLNPKEGSQRIKKLARDVGRRHVST